MSFKQTQPYAPVVLVNKGTWTAGTATVQNNMWTYTPSGGVPQEWVDTVGGGNLPASPTAGNGTTPGRYVEFGEINTATALSPLWTIGTVQTAAFTAVVGTDYPVDTTSGAFTITLPAATVSGTANPTRVRFVNAAAAATVTNVATITPAGTDVINVLASNLPFTAGAGDTIELQCKVAGKWSVV